MKTLAISIGTVIVVGAAFTVFLSIHKGTSDDLSVKSPSSSVVQTPMITSEKATQRSSDSGFTTTLKTGKSPSFAESFKQSHNYLDFARSTIDAAKGGDPEAQYFLGKALGFCDETYRAFFQRKGQRLALDEALVYAAQMHRSNKFTQSVYDRCHDLKSEKTQDFGTAMDWIREAAKANQPIAQATLAVVLLSEETLRAIAAPSGDNLASGVPMEDKQNQWRAMLLAAVQSRNPEAIWNVGRAVASLSQGFDEKVNTQLAWWLVSCQRGLDCSSNADWLQLDCHDESYCPGISGTDYIRNAAAANWPDVEQRAGDISAKLDAGNWNELGFGS